MSSYSRPGEQLEQEKSWIPHLKIAIDHGLISTIVLIRQAQ